MNGTDSLIFSNSFSPNGPKNSTNAFFNLTSISFLWENKTLIGAISVTGLNGTVKTVAKPVIITGAGLIGMQMLKNPIARNIAIGVAAVGAANAVSEVFNFPVFSKITGSSPVPALPPTPTTAGLGNPNNLPWGYANEIRPAKRLSGDSFPRLTNVL